MGYTALITGGSEGIGKAIALLMANKGYDIVLAARHVEQLEATAEEIKALGRDVLTVPTDVRDAEQVDALVQKALAHYGAIDVLVNNAGIYISGPVEEFSLSDWHQAIDTNLWGYIHTIHALLPHFLQRGSGTIINISSIGGKVPIPYLTPYTTSKFAVTGLTEALHSELAPKGVHVCGIYPSIIKSNFLQRAIFRGKNEEDTKVRREQVEQVVSVPVVEKPEDVANAVWDALKNRKSEVLVGSANMSAVANRMFPSLLQSIMRRTFKLKDQT